MPATPWQGGLRGGRQEAGRKEKTLESVFAGLSPSITGLCCRPRPSLQPLALVALLCNWLQCTAPSRLPLEECAGLRKATKLMYPPYPTWTITNMEGRVSRARCCKRKWRALLVSPEPFPEYEGHSKSKVEGDLGKHRKFSSEETEGSHAVSRGNPGTEEGRDPAAHLQADRKVLSERERWMVHGRVGDGGSGPRGLRPQEQCTM